MASGKMRSFQNFECLPKSQETLGADPAAAMESVIIGTEEEFVGGSVLTHLLAGSPSKETVELKLEEGFRRKNSGEKKGFQAGGKGRAEIKSSRIERWLGNLEMKTRKRSLEKEIKEH
jgi:hypothetical protein